MRSKNGTGRKILTEWLLASLWVLSLLAVSLTSSAEPQQKPKPPTPIIKKTLTIHLEVYRSYDEVKRACDPDWPTGIAGCAWPMLDGSHKLQVIQPRSWCDWQNIRTWGHELMHAAGYHHAEKHIFQGGNNYWAADACGFTDKPEDRQ